MTLGGLVLLTALASPAAASKTMVPIWPLRDVAWYQAPAFETLGWAFSGWTSVGDGGAEGTVRGPDGQAVGLRCRARLDPSLVPAHIFGCRMLHANGEKSSGPERWVAWSTVDGPLAGVYLAQGEESPIVFEPGAYPPWADHARVQERAQVSFNFKSHQWLIVDPEADANLMPLLLSLTAHMEPRVEWRGGRLGHPARLTTTTAVHQARALAWLEQALPGTPPPVVVGTRDHVERNADLRSSLGAHRMYVGGRVDYFVRQAPLPDTQPGWSTHVGGFVSIERFDAFGGALSLRALFSDPQTIGVATSLQATFRPTTWLRLLLGPNYQYQETTVAVPGSSGQASLRNHQLGGLLSVEVALPFRFRLGLVGHFEAHGMLSRREFAERGTFDQAFFDDLPRLRGSRYSDLGFMAGLGIALGGDLLVGGGEWRQLGF